MPYLLIAVILGVGLLGYEKKDDIKTAIAKVDGSWTRFDDLFKTYGQNWGVDWQWLKAIALNESSLGEAKTVKRGLDVPTDIEGSKSYDGLSWGLMQVTLKTAQWLDSSATEVKLNDPSYSINLAARYLAYLSRQFSGTASSNMEWIIKSYNQGPGNSQKERAGTIAGYAGEYWARFQRNLTRVKEG